MIRLFKLRIILTSSFLYQKIKIINQILNLYFLVIYFFFIYQSNDDLALKMQF